MPNKTHDLPGYRWVIVLTAAAMLAMAMGVMVNGMSVFFIPLNLEFGWSRGSIALINSAGLIGLAVGGIAMGGIADQTNIENWPFRRRGYRTFPIGASSATALGNSICCSSSPAPLAAVRYSRRSSCLSEPGFEPERVWQLASLRRVRRLARVACLSAPPF